MKKLNLNSFVKVKLNDRGKDIFYHQYDELNRLIVGRGGKPIEPRYPEVDADGYSRFQLWKFMDIYGRHMAVGAPAMTETMNIYIEEKDLEEV